MPPVGRRIEAMSTTTPLSPTTRSTPRRNRQRARTEREELYAVLDEALICHLGVLAGGAPIVLPTCFGREENTRYLHGSTGAASLRTAVDSPVCVTVTLLDGLVYARSVMHHSANYRSAVVHGNATLLSDGAQRLRGLRAIVEHTTPGSWEHARQPSGKELAATAVLALDLTEASVKVRAGPPVDDDEDVDAAMAWAGVLPVRTTFGDPAPCPHLPPAANIPPHILTR
jgi:nitroimidazol reductase NimA-like FMN-containing flavoprotein (pyridoxamine 5'-phosphate oxidase superfamily)